MALLIPIIAVSGGFVVGAFSIYYRYKRESKIADSIPADSLSEWCEVQARIRALRRRGAALRWGGFLGGAGLGLVISTIIVACMPVDAMIATQSVTAECGAGFDGTTGYADDLQIALTILFAGAGLVGAYFLEKRLDRKA